MMRMAKLPRIGLTVRIRLAATGLENHAGRRTATRHPFALEDGGGLLLETGGRMLAERRRGVEYPTAPVAMPATLQLESGGILLLERGNLMKLENQ